MKNRLNHEMHYYPIYNDNSESCHNKLSMETSRIAYQPVNNHYFLFFTSFTKLHTESPNPQLLLML